MIKQTFAFALLTTILFSCSTSNNVVNNSLFQKRKYNKGWHFKNGSNGKSNGDVSHEKTSTNENAISKAANSEEIVNVANIETSFPVDLNSIKRNEEIEATNNMNDKPIKSEKSNAVNETLDGSSEIELNKEQNKKDSKRNLKKENQKNNSKGNSDAELILLVILAFLLPPLAVFLARGIGTEFWISLILTILFWLPGIIYALLVVFDVV